MEISGTLGGEWIRVEGELVRDESHDVKVKMLEEYPTLKQMYNLNDSIMEVLYLKEAKATIYSFTAEPKEIIL